MPVTQGCSGDMSQRLAKEVKSLSTFLPLYVSNVSFNDISEKEDGC